MKLHIRKISVKLMLFNVLLLALPMMSLLYLDTYEQQLLKAQESSMIQQARMLSAALAGSGDLASEAQRIITNLNGRVDSRIRVVDAGGLLLADSALFQEPPASEKGSRSVYSFEGEPRARDTLLYKLAVYPINTFKNLLLPPAPELQGGEYYSGKSLLDGSEIKRALEGRYGAATRFSSGGQRSINLYSAIPVYRTGSGGSVAGAVLVSRSTFQILTYLYELRLDIIRIFLIFLLVSVVISFALAMSLTVPVVRLKNEAGSILDESGNFRNHFTGFTRGDEIGELSRSLTRLSSDLERKMEFISRFTSDMLHELKNPLSTIRNAAAMALTEPARGSEMLGRIIEEEKRMERLLGELREISRLENRFESEKTNTINPSDVLPVLLSRYSNIVYEDLSDRVCRLRMNIDRFVQAVTNPVDNALSFSPADRNVDVRLENSDGSILIVIEDSGPGIPAGTEESVFERFYSGRDGDERRRHSGLGLAIVRSITDFYGGTCLIGNLPEGGCRFTLSFPVCTD